MSTSNTNKLIPAVFIILVSLFFISKLEWETIAKNTRVFLSEHLTSMKTGKRKVMDIGSSPVYTARSKTGGFDRDLSLPELIDVEPIPTTYQDKWDALVALILQREIICTNWEMFGHKTYGGWPVCKAKPFIPRKPCTVYSFGGLTGQPVPHALWTKVGPNVFKFLQQQVKTAIVGSKSPVRADKLTQYLTRGSDSPAGAVRRSSDHHAARQLAIFSCAYLPSPFFKSSLLLG